MSEQLDPHPIPPPHPAPLSREPLHHDPSQRRPSLHPIQRDHRFWTETDRRRTGWSAGSTAGDELEFHEGRQPVVNGTITTKVPHAPDLITFFASLDGAPEAAAEFRGLLELPDPVVLELEQLRARHAE